MATARSSRFRLLLDLVKHAILAVDGTSVYLRSFIRNAHPRQVPAIGESVGISSQSRMLAGWFVASGAPATASVLIFHGLGDRIHYWRAAQLRLAEDGIASLVFHYSGYGESEGVTTPENLEADARAAYAWLCGRTSCPIFLLGFSLGTGLAAEVSASLDPPPAGLILSQAFTSLRGAARRMARPLPCLAALLPDIWKTRDTVAGLRIPLLTIHATGDKLFPVAMAETIAASARQHNPGVQLTILEGLRHNAIFAALPEDYWRAIIEFIRNAANIVS